jgi:hypothetical protein
MKINYNYWSSILREIDNLGNGATIHKARSAAAMVLSNLERYVKLFKWYDYDDSPEHELTGMSRAKQMDLCKSQFHEFLEKLKETGVTIYVPSLVDSLDTGG